MFTLDEFGTECKAAFELLMADLPSSISQRLRISRKAKRHGSEFRNFHFDVWDRAQPGFLERDNFSYGVSYDPTGRYHPYWRSIGVTCHFFPRFYANKHKIYDSDGEVVKFLRDETKLAEGLLSRWRALENNQMINLVRPFDAGTPEEIQSEVYQAFLELIPYWHDRYSAIVDCYGSQKTAEEIAKVIAERRKFQPSGPRSIVARPEYSRHIPTRLRLQVLERDGRKCLKCPTTEKLHVDHIIPVSIGGITVIENLQTLCSVCNLRKGNRETTDHRR